MKNSELLVIRRWLKKMIYYGKLSPHERFNDVIAGKRWQRRSIAKFVLHRKKLLDLRPEYCCTGQNGISGTIIPAPAYVEGLQQSGSIIIEISQELYK